MKTVAVILTGLLIAGAVAWYAGEQHYDNCLQRANAANPVGAPPSEPEGYFDEPRGEQFRKRLSARREALDGCSRVPW